MNATYLRGSGQSRGSAEGLHFSAFYGDGRWCKINPKIESLGGPNVEAIQNKALKFDMS